MPGGEPLWPGKAPKPGGLPYGGAICRVSRSRGEESSEKCDRGSFSPPKELYDMLDTILERLLMSSGADKSSKLNDAQNNT